MIIHICNGQSIYFIKIVYVSFVHLPFICRVNYSRLISKEFSVLNFVDTFLSWKERCFQQIGTIEMSESLERVSEGTVYLRDLNMTASLFAI